jgi:hypothetical protein
LHFKWESEAVLGDWVSISDAPAVIYEVFKKVATHHIRPHASMEAVCLQFPGIFRSNSNYREVANTLRNSRNFDSALPEVKDVVMEAFPLHCTRCWKVFDGQSGLTAHSKVPARCDEHCETVARRV